MSTAAKLLVLGLVAGANSLSIDRPPAVTKVFAFGDSYTETKFNVSLPQPNPDNPIGNPAFPGNTTSGGRNYITSAISEFNTTTIYAYDLAVGGATIDHAIVPAYKASIPSLVQQVQLFNKSYASTSPLASWDPATTLFTTWFGINDLQHGYHISNWSDLVVPRLVARYGEQAEALHSLGARNFVWLTVPPLERTERGMSNGPEYAQEWAVAVDVFNGQLGERYNAFKGAHCQDSNVFLLHTAAPFNKALDDPLAYGAADATCGSKEGHKCLWWNGFHPAIAIHKLVAEELSKIVRL